MSSRPADAHDPFTSSMQYLHLSDSPVPTASGSKYDAIPQEIKDLPNWVNYMLVPKVDETGSPVLKPNGTQKMDKIPYDPKVPATRKKNASSTDPHTWGTFEQAVANEAGFAGIGFMFGTEGAKSGFAGFDADDCVTNEQIAGWAKSVLNDVNSYAETSQSGEGIHSIFRGHLAGSGTKIGSAELYDCKRFFAFTGKRLKEYPADVRAYDCSVLYDRIKSHEFDFRAAAKKKSAAGNKSSAETSVQIENDFGKASTNKTKLLMTGDISSQKPFIITDNKGNHLEYPSQSEADEALCCCLAFKYGENREKIDQEFRKSSLYREKWDREETYRKPTIQRAVDFWNQHKPPVPETPQSKSQNSFAESGSSPTPNEPAKSPWPSNTGDYAKTSASQIEIDAPKLPTSASPLIVRPTLDETAFYGLAGTIIKKLQPQTESHPAGNLLELLLSYGNVLGRSAYFQVESTRHYTNEFMVKVGESAKARKGTGKNRIRAIMDMVDAGWRRNCNTSGIGSGEVIVHLIRDARSELVTDKKTGAATPTIIDTGVVDKRLCVSIGEFQGILAVCHKPEGLLSVVFRDGWDGEPLKNTVKNDPATCMEGHLTIMADTTRVDLSVSLNQADRRNGFANRFLWVYVYRTQLLPMGGDDIDWSAEAEQLRQAVEFGRHSRRVFMDKPARDFWCRTLYPKLERDVPGLVGSIIARGAAHVLRLALMYALLDLSEHIRFEHLEAAYAFWRYCEDSVEAIFGDLISPEQSQILDFLAAVGPTTKTRLIHDCFKNNRKADLIQNDLDVLESRGKIARKAIEGVWWYSKLGVSNMG
jgi:hypothetical protein